LKILVTGGAGFIGRHLCRRLFEDGHDVHITSRQKAPKADTAPSWSQADMADLAAARGIISDFRPDVVFHLAGSVGASPDIALVIPTFQSLLASTINVLLAGTEFGCRRIILIGSLTEPTAGEAGATPQAPYAAAKWAASGYGRMFYRLYQTPVVILRPFMTYGPGQAADKLIPAVTLSLLAGKPPALADGNYKCDWVYISDVIDGFVAAATVQGIEGKTIDLGSGTVVPMRDVVGRLVGIINSDVIPEFGAMPTRPYESVATADTKLAATLLGWRAKTPLEEGLRQTVEWYKKNGGALG
jgi:UDP-glucose 4-epimerase